MTNAENIGAPAAKAVKKKASGSSFYIAMRLMPEEERDAMFAIYAFCRKVDDIADDGVGIPDDIQTRIFDPFFTTKEMGKGTGMGLEVVQRIVQQHNGSIKVISEPGHTAFVVCFPIDG